MYSAILIQQKKRKEREHQFVMFPGSPIHPCSSTSMKMQKLEWCKQLPIQWRWNFSLLVNALVHTSAKKIIWQTLQHGFNLNSFKSEGLHEKHTVATCKLVTLSAFA
jgi:hypothetical protein